MRKGIILAIAGLAFLTGCENEGNKAANTPPVSPKVKVPYRIEFDTTAPKPNPAGVALPAINYTATSQALERRASLVVRFDSSGLKKDTASVNDQMITPPVDMPDPSGTIRANFMDLVDDGLGKMLAAACVKGKVKVNVVLVRSSIKPNADDAEIDAKRLSDWVPVEVTYKNPHPKC